MKDEKDVESLVIMREVVDEGNNGFLRRTKVVLLAVIVVCLTLWYVLPNVCRSH